MQLLLVASECAPFIKTGGLADVIGALPKALAGLGVRAKVLLPLYPALRSIAGRATSAFDMGDLYGGPVRVLEVEAEGIELLLLDAPHLFDREGSIYLDETGFDRHDNYLRFGALSRAAARLTVDGFDEWKPDVVHIHDWQAGLVPVYLRQAGNSTPCVLTIHNIAFQGLFDPSVCEPLGLLKDGFTPDGFEFFGKVGFLKAGINYSDTITTVSPTYARELMLPEFGMGLDGVLRSRKSDVTGILNGIDLDIWNPQTDAAIARTYSSRSLKRKAANKAALEARFDLGQNEDAPLFCVVSRLTSQKGLDVLLQALPNLVERGARLAVLGSGEAELEVGFREAARRFPDSVGVVIGYDEDLSHLMQAGSDAILIPSRFEPCGLTQLYGLRYGTLPVVARTGGLADTVIDANEAAISSGCATGIQFAPVTAIGLGHAIDRACDLFGQPKIWAAMMRNAMRQEVGWETSAATYSRLFRSLFDPSEAEVED